MPGAPEDYEKMSETAKPMSRYKTTAGILIAVAALIAGLVPLLGYESPGGCDGRGRQKGEAMIDNLIRNFLYYPIVRDSQDKLPGYIRGADEVWMNSSDGNRIHALHWPAPAGRPTILFFHGNAQSVFEWALIVEEFESMECGLLLVDYPGYGKSTGSPSEAGLYASGQAAWNWLVSEAKIAPEFIVAFGKSLGGPVASKVAHDNRVMGLVLESTFMSIPAVAQRLQQTHLVGDHRSSCELHRFGEDSSRCSYDRTGLFSDCATRRPEALAHAARRPAAGCARTLHQGGSRRAT